MTAAAPDNQNLTARQAQRMLHFVKLARRLLDEKGVAEREGAQYVARCKLSIDDLITEVEPIIWPKPVIPPDLQDRNGNTR